MQVQTVKLIADLEEEHAEDQHCDQDIESDPKLHNHGHAIGRTHGAEEQAVLH